MVGWSPDPVDPDGEAVRAVRTDEKAETARRAVATSLFAVATLAAAGLMLSGMVDDPWWRAAVQVWTLLLALSCGVVCAVLAWRWWLGWSTDEARHHPVRR